MKTFSVPAFLIAMMLFTGCKTHQHIVLTPAEMKSNIENQHYTFKANYVIPSGNFQSKYLSPGYDLKIRKDTIEAYLPYFGVVYEAPFNPNEGGIKFTSKKFQYQLTKTKKERNWTANIRILDQQREILLIINIWDNGNADLTVNDFSKQTIFFRGEIE